ncbi:unnamed protein product [Lactuca virosa]|uniref:GRF-type domain-containing protein n=1 Tax=Lactuca virosa TaxID=75947 RepID=A0AAU9MXE6_9ASTR|nr:unnamed protein product [Lactuca virosa]
MFMAFSEIAQQESHSIQFLVPEIAQEGYGIQESLIPRRSHLLQVSRASENPGRRFYGCPNYKDESMNCKYFIWIDDELTIQRYKDLLFNMHHDMKGMEDEIKELKLKLKKKSVFGM